MARIRWRHFAPKTWIDLVAMLFTVVMIPVAFFHGVFYIAPSVWPTHTDALREANGTAYALNVGLMTLLLVGGLANLWLTVTVDTGCGRVALPVVAQPGWHFCPYCQHYAPPRAHHCGSCARCILRHDHHCFFAGKCIGYHNHRYFLSFLIYVLCGGVYATLLSFWAISMEVGGAWWRVLPALVFPVLMWVLQMVPANVLVMLLTSLAIFVTLGAGALLALQLVQVWYGQTFWELRHKVCRYDQGLLGNVREVLGARWWVAWLVPLASSALPGDGAHFPPLDHTPLGHMTPSTAPATEQRRGRKPV